jgi:hypothetical protein
MFASNYFLTMVHLGYLKEMTAYNNYFKCEMIDKKTHK